jgi:hypothetical protein
LNNIPCSLSIVSVSRNDDHGGNLLERTQCFIDGIAQRFGDLPGFVELVLVEWNPPGENAKLAQSLDWRRLASSAVSVRIIEVPAELHKRFSVASALPLLQMIGKNVGIRRARGEFVLCTNIDIIFSESLSRLLVSGALRKDRMYRAERIDVRDSVARASIIDIESACNESIIRRNQRVFPLGLSRALKLESQLNLAGVVSQFPDFQLESYSNTRVLTAGRTTKPELLFTNACGDFTLLHREAWASVRGYPEFDAFSFNIDSLGCYLAHYSGFLESTFIEPSVCYHIEHATGSGWTPEGEKLLFSRLRALGLRWPEWTTFMPIVRRMRSWCDLPIFNTESWGLREFTLPEISLEPTGEWSGDRLVQSCGAPRVYPDLPVSALRDEWVLSKKADYDQSILRRFCTVFLSKSLNFSQRAVSRVFGVLCRVSPTLADFLYCKLGRRI